MPTAPINMRALVRVQGSCSWCVPLALLRGFESDCALSEERGSALLWMSAQACMASPFAGDRLTNKFMSMNKSVRIG